MKSITVKRRDATYMRVPRFVIRTSPAYNCCSCLTLCLQNKFTCSLWNFTHDYDIWLQHLQPLYWLLYDTKSNAWPIYLLNSVYNIIHTKNVGLSIDTIPGVLSHTWPPYCLVSWLLVCPSCGVSAIHIRTEVRACILSGWRNPRAVSRHIWPSGIHMLGPSIYSGHYTTSVNCCNRTFYCNDNKITEFDMINTKNSSTAYVVIYKLIT